MIKNLYTQDRPVFSFEVFPPKKDDDIAGIYAALGEMTALAPDFISVTYGAGGAGGKNKTAEIASFIEEKCGTQALAHLTCVGTGREQIRHTLDEMRAVGITNILALRGDLPPGGTVGEGYRYASELIQDIRAYGGFCIGAACYPEGHISCDDLEQDMQYLLQKQQAGADFLITQLFFENDTFFRFYERALAAGITIPVSAGIMPILGRQQIERMIFMCGASLPSGIIRLLHKYEDSPEDLRKAGIEYAARQARELLEQEVDGVHIYTMNKPDIARRCAEYARGTK